MARLHVPNDIMTHENWFAHSSKRSPHISTTGPILFFKIFSFVDETLCGFDRSFDSTSVVSSGGLTSWIDGVPGCDCEQAAGIEMILYDATEQHCSSHSSHTRLRFTQPALYVSQPALRDEICLQKRALTPRQRTKREFRSSYQFGASEAHACGRVA